MPIKNTPPMSHIMAPRVRAEMGIAYVASIDVDVSIDIDIHSMMVPVPVTPPMVPKWAYCAEKGEIKCKPYCCISERIIPERRISGIPPWPINYVGVIDRDIDDLRIRRRDLDGISLCGHLLLLAAL